MTKVSENKPEPGPGYELVEGLEVYSGAMSTWVPVVSLYRRRKVPSNPIYEVELMREINCLKASNEELRTQLAGGERVQSQLRHLVRLAESKESEACERVKLLEDANKAANRAIEDIAVECGKLKSQSPWISCKERMPTEEDADQNGDVLWLFLENGNGPFVDAMNWKFQFTRSKPTHWSRIPPLPQPEKSEEEKAFEEWLEDTGNQDCDNAVKGPMRDGFKAGIKAGIEFQKKREGK